jgi:hypothetical protein
MQHIPFIVIKSPVLSLNTEQTVFTSDKGITVQIKIKLSLEIQNICPHTPICSCLQERHTSFDSEKASRVYSLAVRLHPIDSKENGLMYNTQAQYIIFN